MELVFSVVVYSIASFLVAAITVSYAILIGNSESLKLRTYLPLLCGAGLCVMLYLVPESLAGILVLLIVPCFIFTPAPFIEKLMDSVFSKKAIFFGAVLISLYYFGISTAGTYFFNLCEKPFNLFWMVFTIVPAFLIFLGISLGQRFLTDITEDAESDSDRKSRRSEEWMAAILILGFIVFCIPLYLMVLPGDRETAAGFNVYSLQESQINSSTIIHLTDKDFREFPRLALIIRDGNHNDCYSESASCIAEGSYSFGEQQKFQYYSSGILEYRNRYYSLKKTWTT